VAAAPLLLLRVVLVGLERVALRRLGDFASPTACAAAFFGVGALVLLPFARLGQLPHWAFLRVALPAGLLYAVAYWFYVSALAQGEVSAAAPLSALGGLFVVVLGRLVYGEPLTLAKTAGALLVAGGAAAAQGAPRPGAGARPALQMGAYALLSAVTRMLDKAVAVGGGPAAGTYAFCVFTITALAQLGLLAVSGGLGELGGLIAGRPALALAAGACNGGSFLLLLAALASVPVSVAEPVTALSLLVSAAVAAVWLGERVGPRLLPTAAVVAGTWLLVGGGPLP